MDNAALQALRADALDERRSRLTKVLSNPDACGWPEEYLATGRTREGDEGVMLKSLAWALGCHSQSVRRIAKPIGVAAIGNKPVYLFDPASIDELRDHPKIVASRERMANTLADHERVKELIDALDEAVNFQLVGLRVSKFRTIDETAFDMHALTVLVGKNGAGKSSLLDAVRADLGDLQGEPGWRRSTFTIEGEWPYDDDTASRTAAYCSIGLPDDVAAITLPILRHLIVHPALVGAPGRWVAGVRLPSGASERAAAERLRGSDSKLSSWVSALLQTVRSAGSHDYLPLPRLDIEGPKIAVSILGADADSLSAHLFASIPQISRSSRRSTNLSVDDLDTAPVESRYRSDSPPKAVHQRIEFRWKDNLGFDASPGRASMIHLIRHGGSSHEVVKASIDDFAGLEEMFESLNKWSENSQGREGESGVGAASIAIAGLLRRHGPSGAGSPWFASDRGQRIRSLACLMVIESIANSVAPEFIAASGRIMLFPPQSIDATDVEVGLIDSMGRFVRLSKMSSGVARWVVLLVGFAESITGDLWPQLEIQDPTVSEVSIVDEASDLAEEILAITPDNRSSLQLLLADEPELHLHPSAQEEVALWAMKVSRTTSVLVATHAPAFLQLSPAEARLVRVARDLKGKTVAESLDGDFLQHLDALAQDIGLGRERLLQLVRGLVVVEGDADATVLKRFAREVLDRYRLALVPIGGHSRSKSFVDGDLALAIGLPIAVMFDELTAEAIALARSDPKAKVPDEVRSVLRILQLRERGLDCAAISFDAPDIVAAIPEATVRRRFPNFLSWLDVTQTWKASESGVSFKNHVLDSWGVSRRDDLKTITELAVDRRVDEPLTPPIARALNELAAWAESLGLDASMKDMLA